ncbi:MAG: cytochrome c-type biogenesis protein CcmH [marine benthic group bacterium]|jgi:cytochrome c-type biogenesis protein CcmH|nr:cytochrome c-type biogenesis protein CcmH [Candidatus Benthicola marisminoris]
MSRFRAGVLALLLTCAIGPSSATAQESEPSAETTATQEAEAPTEEADDRSALTDPEEEALDALAAEVASGLRCPVCRNQSVVESNAELSREMQAVVRDRLAAGETPEEVEAYFVSRYGEWILLQPQARGINLLVYGLPALALIVGFFIARKLLHKWTGAADGAVPADGSPDLAAEDEQWLREALRES